MPRLLIVDDHPLICLGITRLMEDEFDILVGDTLEGVVASLKNSEVDFAIVDIVLKSISGLEIVRKIRDESPSTKIIVLTQIAEPLYEVRARLAGAHAFLGKQSLGAELINAVSELRKGNFYPASFAQKNGVEDPISALSDRELEIFSMLGEGQTSAQIAKRLDRSRKTIDTFRDRIKIKFGLTSGVELTRMATHWHFSEHHRIDLPNI